MDRWGDRSSLLTAHSSEFDGSFQMSQIILPFFRLDYLFSLTCMAELGSGAKGIVSSYSKSSKDVEAFLGSTARSGSLGYIAHDP
jgi:hypothetical protein